LSGYLGVNAVEKGTYLKIDKFKKMTKSPWYFGGDSRSGDKNPDDLVQSCEEILIDAIKIRCRADVPLAITLSGGIDSTTIYTLIKEHLQVDIQPFVFKHLSESTDESELATGWLKSMVMPRLLSNKTVII
jgi:asparagine synthase (glutamine-hydrolysing)